MEELRVFFKKIIPPPLFLFFQPAYHWVLAFGAALVYGFPSRTFTLVGVTGTNGKTTVVHLLHEIFIAAGYRVGSLSSLRFKINDREEKNLLKMTMPGRFRLQQFLARCRDASCHFVILEVTSEGIKQFRHCFMRFGGAVLTNITPEHIEAHGSFDAYRAAKAQIFSRLRPSGTAIVNQEDPSSSFIAARVRGRLAFYSRSALRVESLLHPVRIKAIEPERLQFTIDDVFFETRLGGEFNLLNILAAITTAMAFHVPPQSIVKVMKGVASIPGRLEYLQRVPFRVVVDYAHTPDALEKVYILWPKTAGVSQRMNASPESRTRQDGGEYINPGLWPQPFAERTPAMRPKDDGTSVREYRGGKPADFYQTLGDNLICVFGSAGGGRDKWKRPELGKIAGKFCKSIILTSDDSDDEDPARIAAEIRSGMTNDEIRMTKIVLDRRAAIREALESAKPGDTVIITGMGAQPWIVIDGKKIPWDDREVVREELARLTG